MQPQQQPQQPQQQGDEAKQQPQPAEKRMPPPPGTDSEDDLTLSKHLAAKLERPTRTASFCDVASPLDKRSSSKRGEAEDVTTTDDDDALSSDDGEALAARGALVSAVSDSPATVARPR